MKFAICEIGKGQHLHCVIAIVKIVASQPENRIQLLVKSGSSKDVKELEAFKNVEIFESTGLDNSEQYLSKFNKEAIDFWMFPTLEPTSTYNLKIYKILRKIRPTGKLFFGIHNTNLWFNFGKTLTSIPEIFTPLHKGYRIYQLKLRFFSVFSGIVKKMVNRSKGKFFVVSQGIKDELLRLSPNEKIIVIPSDIYNPQPQEMLNLNDSDSGTLRLVIPGFISDKRRDYTGFLNALKLNLKPEYKDKLTVDLLGKPTGGLSDGELIIQLATSLIADGFKINLYGKEFIPMNVFDDILMKADIIGGIINPDENFQIYGKTKESGAPYTMIKSAKPGFLPVNYQFSEDLSGSIVFYNNMKEMIHMIMNLMEDTNHLNSLKKKALDNSLKFTPELIWNRIKKDFN